MLSTQSSPYSKSKLVADAFKNLKARQIPLAYPTRYRECLILRFENLGSESQISKHINDYQTIIMQQGKTPTLFILDMTSLRLTADVPVLRVVNLQRLLATHFQIVVGAPSLITVYTKIVQKFTPTNIEFVRDMPEATLLAQRMASEDSITANTFSR